MQLDISLLPMVMYVVMAFLMWMFPPRWVKGAFKDAGTWFEDLKTWAPRLVGAVKHGTVEEVKAQAMDSSNPLVQTLVALGDIAPMLTDIMPLIQKYGPALLEQLGNPSAAPGAAAAKEGGGLWS